jgi:hypothetical protein
LTAKPKQRVSHAKRKTGPKRTASVLEQFHCETLRYDFEIPKDSFKTQEFSKETDLEPGDLWRAILPTDDPLSGYHVHFSGGLQGKRVHMRIEYWNRPVKRLAKHPPPSSESAMAFAGSFIREPSARARVFAAFAKPAHLWRSRFNLPFKVTMAGAEVVIDGLSLTLPKNGFNAMNGWLTKLDNVLLVNVDRTALIDFAAFNLAADLTILNESIKMFVEQII